MIPQNGMCLLNLSSFDLFNVSRRGKAKESVMAEKVDDDSDASGEDKKM